MDGTRKPEWIPEGAGPEYASRVMPASETGETHKVAPWRKKRPSLDLESLEDGILKGDVSRLSQAITLIESNLSAHFEAGQELIRRILPHSGNSFRIGITGVPGAGKSTFIESFGSLLIERGKKVAVLAIDPSSSISKGSILGDKTRMEKLSRHQNSFIRPSPSSGILGGVARKTRETMILCEAAGFDTILIETVGVGQSEITVRSMVDIFLLLQIAGAGDELQGIKKGIMELCDLIVINKSDGDNIQAAKLAKAELDNALHYTRNYTPGWKTRTLLASALEETGLDDIYATLKEFWAHAQQSHEFDRQRQRQTLQWFESLLEEAVLSHFFGQGGVKEQLAQLKDEVKSQKTPVVLAVKKIIDRLGG